ncbi:MAG: hypothetical protein ACI8RZ_004231 [Myxococcota bacterium]
MDLEPCLLGRRPARIQLRQPPGALEGEAPVVVAEDGEVVPNPDACSRHRLKQRLQHQRDPGQLVQLPIRLGVSKPGPDPVGAQPLQCDELEVCDMGPPTLSPLLDNAQAPGKLVGGERSVAEEDQIKAGGRHRLTVARRVISLSGGSVVGAWAVMGLFVGCERGPDPPPPAAGARRHALLIVVDTLRAGSVQRTSTPNIDALAIRGGAANRAWAASTWTAPSMISIFTGTTLREHGWDYPMPTKMEKQGAYPPIPALPTIAERLSGLGFETTGLYANPIVRPELGFDRGFDSYSPLSSDRDAAGLVAGLVAGWDDDERHFLYLHLLGPHQPLRPSAAAQERWDVGKPWVRKKAGFNIKRVWRDEAGALSAYVKAYHAVVEDTDARIGDILAALGEHREDTVIVLTSDHGEMLGEHGRAGHGSWVYEPLTWVPFVAEGAGPVPTTVSNAAAADAITRGLGLDLAWSVRLDSALPLVSQREGKLALSPDGRLKGIWDPSFSDGGFEVFDLSVDPGEERPVEGQGADLMTARGVWESGITAGMVTGEPIEVSEDMEEALKALGYIE